MSWVVDTCLLLDVGLDDPNFGPRSEKLLIEKQSEGLLICPITFIELAPAFGGEKDPLERFLFNLGIESQESWSWRDTLKAHEAWSRYVELRRAKQTAKRPIADVLIGAFASRFRGLLTRNSPDFARVFPSLIILEP